MSKWVYMEGDIVAFDDEGNSLGVVDLNQHAHEIAALLDERDELQAKVNRLVSRGIEDLRHENAELKARLTECKAETKHFKDLVRRMLAN